MGPIPGRMTSRSRPTPVSRTARTAPRSEHELIAVVRALRSNLHDVDRALAKMDAGTYGTCERCGSQITEERLEAIPLGAALHRLQEAGRMTSPGRRVPRVCLLVCDSWGVGDAPDAATYGDEGSNTLGNTSREVGGLDVPTLESLGLGSPHRRPGVAARAEPGTAHGRATEISAGKDTTTGHWEMMGIRLDRPFPLYPEGFPPEIIQGFERAIGRRVLGNVPASGTEIIQELGEEHLRTGLPDRLHER